MIYIFILTSKLIWSVSLFPIMPKKPSNKLKKGVDKLKNKITREEWDDEAERYRDSDDGKFTRGPQHKIDE